MNRVALFVLAASLASCAVATEHPVATPEAVNAPPPAPVADETEDVDTGREPTVPTGAFATVEALCAAQRTMAAPLIEKANADRKDRYEGSTEEPVVPSCLETRLSNLTVHLAPPFREVRAIRVETGYTTDTHLVVRTDEGWRVTATPMDSDAHDDPGCPSIRRDGPLRAIRVEHGALVIEGSSSRGDGEDVLGDDPDGNAVMRYWTRTYEEVRACRIAGDALRCGPVETIAISRSASDTVAEESVFTTTYEVDDRGRIVTASTYEETY